MKTPTPQNPVFAVISDDKSCLDKVIMEMRDCQLSHRILPLRPDADWPMVARCTIESSILGIIYLDWADEWHQEMIMRFRKALYNIDVFSPYDETEIHRAFLDRDSLLEAMASAAAFHYRVINAPNKLGDDTGLVRMAHPLDVRRSINALLVEEDETIRRVLENLLGMWGSLTPTSVGKLDDPQTLVNLAKTMDLTVIGGEVFRSVLSHTADLLPKPGSHKPAIVLHERILGFENAPIRFLPGEEFLSKSIVLLELFMAMIQASLFDLDL